MKEWHFYDKVYRRWVVLFIGPQIDFIQELRANEYHHVNELEEPGLGMCVELLPSNNGAGQNATVVWLAKYDLPTLVHEISHLVMMLFNQVEVPISRDNTEAFAFYAEFWFNEMRKTIKLYPKGLSAKRVKV